MVLEPEPIPEYACSVATTTTPDERKLPEGYVTASQAKVDDAAVLKGRAKNEMCVSSLCAVSRSWVGSYQPMLSLAPGLLTPFCDKICGHPKHQMEECPNEQHCDGHDHDEPSLHCRVEI
jgi:hypothetical protein